MTIIVPYRNRPNHLAQFIPHIRTQCPGAKLLIVEQAEGKQWNREKLFNVGVSEYPDEFYIFHDVDMLPIRFNYRQRLGVTQLAASAIQIVDYLGGVTMFSHDVYLKAGGYHNDFWGGRAGDNEMRFNLKRTGIPVQNRFGTFRTLLHPRTGPEFIPELWEKAQKPRVAQDQLSACEYLVVSRKSQDKHTHIVVEI
jgi:hypothetical protein